MEIVTTAAHTPWLWMWAQALPEHTIHTLPYPPHSPMGWREDQRPLPANVEPEGDRDNPDMAADAYWLVRLDGEPDPDVVVCHTAYEMHQARVVRGYAGPLVYVLHNHAHWEGDLPERLRAAADLGPLAVVAISEMKADSLRSAGWVGDLRREHDFRVIYPYVDPEWFLPRAADTAEGPGLTVANDITRPLFDLEWWYGHAEAQQDIYGRVLLVGGGNGTLPGAVGPSPSWDWLRRRYAEAAEYLNPCCEPYEDAWNLAALEAHAAGVPVVARQGGAWRRLTADHTPFAPFDRERFRRGWLAVLAEVCRG
jgi:glycosyltransferase involved in cell wall biosynthesis